MYAFIHPQARLGNNVKVEYGAILYEEVAVGENSIIGAGAVLRPRTKIGKNSIFGTLSVSEGDNEIGDNTTIHAQAHITKGVKIGNNVFIAPFFIASNTPEITPGAHGTAASHKPLIMPTIIEDNVRIGVGVQMTPGHRIGRNAVIDQGSFITHDVPAHAHVRGGKDKVGRILP